MAILDERPLTDAERAASDDEPRTGVWVEGNDGDGRPLSQRETDEAIAAELYWQHLRETVSWGVVEGVLGDINGAYLWAAEDSYPPTAREQRGGIHSDPIVRLLSFRMWGERDRAWRKRDTARAIVKWRYFFDQKDVQALKRAYGFDGLWYSHPEALVTVQRGGRRLQARFGRCLGCVSELDILFDLLDELDAKLAAGGHAASDHATKVEV